MKQIKEKPERIKGLKERVRAAPKEVLRRGTNAGVERMKGQLREARQQEQPEDYASEKVETAVEEMSSTAVSAVVGMRVRRRFAEKRAEDARVKTKETYIHQQEPVSQETPPQALEEGKQAFIEDRKQQAMMHPMEVRREQWKRTGSDTSQVSAPVTNQRFTESNVAQEVVPPPIVEVSAPSQLVARIQEDGPAREPPIATKVKTIRRGELRYGKVIGRTPKQVVKTADTIVETSKPAQAVRQAKNLAVRAVRTTKNVAKETVAVAAKTISAALGGLLAAGGGIVVLIVLVVVLFGGVLLLFGEGPDSTAYTSVSEEVQAYDPLIRLYAEKHGIPEYVELIKAIMMTESGGKGSDPMQAAESAFNTRYPHKPGAITDPEYSIDVGVQTIAATLKQAKVESPLDLEHIKLALQGYNFGNGYISWAADKYGGYSEANAIEFSEMMAKRLGWKRYGSTKYVSVVLQYYPYGHALSDAGSGDFIWPLPGYTRISSPFGYRTCPYHGRELHGGVDLPAPHGTNILAAKGGTVVVSTYGSSYGNYVAISHADGSRTMYCHMSARLVSVGDTVSQGQVIGRVGSTGNSTGNHLHFELWTNGNSSSRVNPMEYF